MNTENNKLMAEFLGYSQPHPEYPQSTYWYKQGKPPITILRFDTDWNWLMEVVDKINNYNNIFSINENKVIITNNEKNEVILIVISGSMKEAVYNACIQFIQWYNQNKTSN